jgi:proteasome lid subunit RPN8/RPN11
MWFTCIPQILARSKPLLLQEEYKLVGAIHTHPDTSELSELDRNTYRIVDPFVEVFGVYNGDRLSMYSSPGQEEPVTSVLRTR